MISRIKESLKKPIISQFIRFCSVGLVGATVNYSIFFILYRFFSVFYLISSATGFIVSVFIAFILNKKFTFKIEKNIDSRFIIVKYYSVNIFSMLIGLGVLNILVEIFKINVYIANLFFVATTTSLNFIGSKLFAFRIKNLN